MSIEPVTHAERSKANRIRLKAKQFQELTTDEKLWIEAYEARTKGGAAAQDVGASQAASRKVTFTEEETAATSVGTGDAAATAASAAMGAALVVREEGKRLDSVLALAMNIMSRAVDTYEKMARQMLSEREQDGKLQRTLLETVRTQYLARAEAEAELIQAEAEHQAEAQSNDGGLENVAVRALIDKFVPNSPQKLPSGDGNPD